MDPASKQAAKYKTQSILGIINDKMEVGMAKIRGEEGAALDVAVIKATLQDEVVPKEKHVRTLKNACSSSATRQTVNYVIHALLKRLEENAKNWLVTLKTLVVFHRLMRETDPSFQEELLRYAERTGVHRMLRLESFADHTTKETWDYSAWIRVYSLYLDERLAVFRCIRFDPSLDQGMEAGPSKLRECASAELLDQLPAAQRLLRQLVSCVPEGAAQHNEVVLLACSLVLKEIRPVYKIVCEGILNLVDRIFEMDRGDALKGVELVKENLAINDRLNAFVSTISNIQPLKGAAQFPAVQPLPADFLTTLEEYVKDAPKSTGEAGKQGLNRAASMPQKAAAGGPRLIVGGPVKDPPSGPTSPAPSQPAPAQEVDLLGGFETLSIAPAQPAPAAAPAVTSGPATAPAAPSAGFDPFANFPGAAAPTAVHPPQPQPPTPVPQQMPAIVPPPAPFPMGVASSFANPAAAAVAAGLPGITPAQQPMAVTTAGVGFNDPFSTGNAFAAPPPAVYSPQAAAPPSGPPLSVAPPSGPPAPFNPFANPSMHAAVMPHMPPGGPAVSPQPGGSTFQPPAPLLPQHVNAFTPSSVPASAPHTPPGSQAPVMSQFAAAPQVTAPGVAPPQAPAFANPFGSPGGAIPQPGAGTYSPGGPSPTNPFGAPTPGAAAGAAAAANPFGAQGGAAAWPGAPAGPAPVMMQQVGGYSLKKAADPLNDLSMDLFGKPQAPPTQQPMRPQAGVPQNGGGSPGNFF